jgi:hypothetical protein
LLDGMKAHLMGLLRWGLSPAQVITHHIAHVKEMALKNELLIWDTFVLLSNVKNLAKKWLNELWQKHCKDPSMLNVGSKKSWFGFLLSSACPYGPQFMNPRWHSIHIGNPNSMIVGNYAKIWAW